MSDRMFRDREILVQAQEKGAFPTFLAYLRLSGPGWLQSAITLGGGSLLGALYLGVLAGTSMLWLQLVAITIGVIMLSAIAYVTLSTRTRPYAAINEYINPVLGVGWITATILANMIWIIPQFALCYDALDKNLTIRNLTEEQRTQVQTDLAALTARDSASWSEDEKATVSSLNRQLESETSGLGNSRTAKVIVSSVLGIAAMFIVFLSFNPGWMAKSFDIILKLIVGMIVICFVAVVWHLASIDALNWNEILMGFVPNFAHWSSPAPSIQELMTQLDGTPQTFWEEQIVAKQRESMIGVTATAVGLNMTFLLPYSMLARGWDKPFRGLARFDLITAMAIPYLIVTTCIVVASAHAFHAKADPNFLSTDPAVMQRSVLFDSAMGVLENRFANDEGPNFVAERKEQLNATINRIQAQLDGTMDESQRAGLLAQLADEKRIKKQRLAEFAASLSEQEKRIAPTLVKPNAAQLAATLRPLMGDNNEKYADLIFGLGAFGMGFSTIIILSLINGYAFAEIADRYESQTIRVIGALAAIAVGFCWHWIWQGESRTWLGIVASTFGAILLPIAYISFFALMNNVRLLGSEKPVGYRMTVWNVLMAIGVLGALAQAWAAISTKANDPVQGPFVIGGVAVFLLLALVGFSARPRSQPAASEESS